MLNVRVIPPFLMGMDCHAASGFHLPRLQLPRAGQLSCHRRSRRGRRPRASRRDRRNPCRSRAVYRLTSSLAGGRCQPCPSPKPTAYRQGAFAPDRRWASNQPCIGSAGLPWSRQRLRPRPLSPFAFLRPRRFGRILAARGLPSMAYPPHLFEPCWP